MRPEGAGAFEGGFAGTSTLVRNGGASIVGLVDPTVAKGVNPDSTIWLIQRQAPAPKLVTCLPWKPRP